MPIRSSAVTMRMEMYFSRRILMDEPSKTREKPTTVTKTPTEVRQGEARGVVRWVLGLSLFGAIIALALIYLFMRG